jgi:hypothetical protein
MGSLQDFPQGGHSSAARIGHTGRSYDETRYCNLPRGRVAILRVPNQRGLDEACEMLRFQRSAQS